MGEVEQRHLFVCPSCRAALRADGIWRRSEEVEPSARVDEAFVQRVVQALLRDRHRRIRNRRRLAAAAALLFFFGLGAGQEQRLTVATGAEEAYSQLVDPPVLDILPD